MYVCMQCLDPSEQLAAILNNIGHAILLSALQSCAKVLHYSPSRCFEEASCPQESEATMREVDLISALQCGV